VEAWKSPECSSPKRSEKKMIRKGEGDILDKVNKLVKVLFANGNQAMGSEIGKWKPGYGK